MVIYIAGPITGIADYREKFSAAERKLKAAGHIVFSPAYLPAGLPRDEYMPIGRAMMDACEAAYFLKGWERSIGARVEFDYATRRGMQLMFE